MGRFEIIPGRQFHCGAMIRRLRAEQREAIAALGVDPHRGLRDNFDMSVFTRAWLIDGQLAGLGGVTGPEISTTGYVWLALSEQATRFPIEVTKEARRQMARIMLTKRELITSIIPEDRKSLRFATWLGFETVDPTPVPCGKGRVILIRYRGNSLVHAA